MPLAFIENGPKIKLKVDAVSLSHVEENVLLASGVGAGWRQ